MTERIIVNPMEVRGLGNIVSAKSTSDYLCIGDKITSDTASINNRTFTVYNTSNLASGSLTLTCPRLIDLDDTSFTVSAVLKNSSSTVVSGATVYCEVNGVTVSDTTNASGQVSFTVNTDGSSLYVVRVYFLGNNSVGGCFKGSSVFVGEPGGLSLVADKPVIQTDDKTNLIATLTGTGIGGETVGIPNQTVMFYEQWTPGLKVSASPNIIQSGGTSTLSAQLIDATDGSIVRESGHTVYIGESTPEITMFKGTETFTRANSGTGTLDIEYSQDNELVYTAAGGVFFLSDLKFKSETNNWICEFQMKATGSDGGRIGLYPYDETTADSHTIAFKTQNLKVYLGINDGGTFSETEIITGYANYHSISIRCNNGDVTVSADGTVKQSVTGISWTDKLLCLGLHGWTTGNVIYVKEFSFKEYTEE